VIVLMMRKIVPMSANSLMKQLLFVVLSFGVGRAEDIPRLPLPLFGIPEMPKLSPTVITAGGQRLLLEDTAVEVLSASGKLKVNQSGCWVINYPLTQIKGWERRSPDEISRQLFRRPAADIRNWYIKSPGSPSVEPSAPKGPAPIRLSERPTMYVDNRQPQANDKGKGTLKTPFKTIGAAIRCAIPGTVIRVYPGIYRESVKILENGTFTSPIRLEGVRDKEGYMPIISGNDVFPPNAWKTVEGLPGVYRASLFTRLPGTVSVQGKTLIERSLPSGLKEGEYCLNRASHDFLNLRFNGEIAPQENSQHDGMKWLRLKSDPEGYIDLAQMGDATSSGVFWASSYIWVEPKTKKGVVWDPRFPQPITGQLEVGGEFRAARMTGAGLEGQVNKYRVWVNGDLLPSVIYSTERDYQASVAHPYRNYGFSDSWEHFVLREGWNHIVLQFDTTTRPRKTRFRFGLPKGIEEVVTSADGPADQTKPGVGQALPYVSECLVIGPFPSERDEGVYVRLSGNADPNSMVMDLSARGTLVSVNGNFVEVRGFEICHGAQFQQSAQVALEGEGVLLEGCLIRDSEVKGISFKCQKDQFATPIVIRNNWVVCPGNTGIGGSGESDKLTPGDQNSRAPGRSPVLIEHNTVIDNNWAGHESLWESGGMKLFKLTGCVIRYNIIVGGCGPGIWLDWEHYGNRLEGNLFRNAWGFCIGIEASPGPNLIANNLSVNLRPGPVWFREAFLAWSSDRNWAVNNTVDGRWNPLPAWQGKTGTGGFYLGEGHADRLTRWVPLEHRRQAFINNLVVGCDSAIQAKREDVVVANYSDCGKGASPLDCPACFISPERNDYRLIPGSSGNTNGMQTAETGLVRHDFNGLLRFPNEKWTVGAFRAECAPVREEDSLIEVEFCDGRMCRMYDIQSSN